MEEEVLEQEVVETPVEEPEVVAEPAPEPMTVATSGEWVLVETLMGKEFEEGKTYHIKVKGNCQFMVSKDKPTVGMVTNEITYKKENDMKLWIKTGV